MNAPSNPRTVGQEVFVLGGYGNSARLFKVAKITPAGQIVLEGGRRFNKDGREIGSGISTWSRSYLDWDVEARKVANRKANARQRARQALNAAGIQTHEHAGKTDMLLRLEEQEALLVAARAAINAIEE